MISPRWSSLRRASCAHLSLHFHPMNTFRRVKGNGCFSTMNVWSEDRGLDEIDIVTFEKLFGYTWLTHLKLLEEDSAFRQHIVEMRISRRLERANYLKYAVDAQNPLIECPSASGSYIGQSLSAIEGSYSEELEWISTQNELMADDEITKGEDGIKALLGGQKLNVSPLWISVFVDHKAKKSSIFESIIPIEDKVVENVDIQMKPFYETDELVFEEQAELKSGPWRNYFIGIVGEVSAIEDGNLWPNQVLHKDRCLYNVRNASDLVKFLADPTKEDIESHLENLERLAEERRYKKGWCWHMLKTRWGERALQKYGILDISTNEHSIKG